MICPHCKLDIPEGTKICDHCRKRIPTSVGRWIILLAGLLGLVWIAGLFMEGPATPPAVKQSKPSPSAAAAPLRSNPVRPGRSPEMQAQRDVLIKNLIRSRIFQKVRTLPGDHLPRVWVRPAFHALDFETKSTFVAIVYDYYLDGSNDTDSVRIYDSVTGEQIGEFNPNLYPNGGLKLE